MGNWGWLQGAEGAALDFLVRVLGVHDLVEERYEQDLSPKAIHNNKVDNLLVSEKV